MCGLSGVGGCGIMCGYSGAERPALMPVARQASCKRKPLESVLARLSPTGQTAGVVVLILISSADRVRFVMRPHAKPRPAPPVAARHAPSPCRRPPPAQSLPAEGGAAARRGARIRAETSCHAPNSRPSGPGPGALVVHPPAPARPHLLASSGSCLLRVRCPSQSDKQKASAAPRPGFGNRLAS